MGRRKSIINDKRYQWDFKEIYKTQDDFEKGIKKTKLYVKNLLTYKGKIKKADAKTYLKFYDLNKKQYLETFKLLIYAQWYVADMKNQEKMQNYGIIQNLKNEFTKKLSWISGEIRDLGEKKILSYISQSKKHAYLEDSIKEYFRRDKMHLPNDKEEFLSNFESSLSAPYDIYRELSDGDYTFPEIEIVDPKTDKRKVKTLNSTLLNEILRTSDAKEDQLLRLTAVQKWNEYHHNLANTFATIYKVHVENEVTVAKLEGFTSPLHYGLWKDNAPEKTFVNFINFIYKNKHLVYDWVKLHRTVMKTKGIKKYYVSDRRLNIVNPKKKDITFSVEEAKRIVKEATIFLGEEYKDALEDSMKDGRIDYFERAGKASGGFMMAGPNIPSYILMNWSGDFSALRTLAHELGHSVHNYLSTKYQKIEYVDSSILTAEIASTFIELVTLHYLIENSKSKDFRIYLLQNLIETISVLYFYSGEEARFEWEAKKMVWEGKPLNKDVLGKLSEDLKLVVDYDKPNKNFPAVDSKYTWSRIMHHFGTTFYLHKYALSFTVSCNLFFDYLKNEKCPNYLKLLKMGGRKAPLDLIKETTGVNLLEMESHKAVHKLWTTTLEKIKKEIGYLE